MFMPKHLLHSWFSRAWMQQEGAGTVSDFYLFFFFQIEFIRTNLAVRSAVLGVAVSERLSWPLHIKWTITVTIIIKSSLQNC